MNVFLVTINDGFDVAVQRVVMRREKADELVFQHAVDKVGYDEACRYRDGDTGLRSLFSFSIDEHRVD